MNNNRYSRFILALLVHIFISVSAQAKSISIDLESPRNFGYSLGDTITLTAQIKVPLFYTLEDGFLPTTGRINEWLDLQHIKRITPQSGFDYALTITYQVFKSVNATEELTIPSLPIRFMHRSRSEIEAIPAWTFSYNPIIPGSKADNLIEVQPEVPVRLLSDESAIRRLIFLFVGLAIVGFYLIWFYGKVSFLERYSGAFGPRCQELKKLKKKAPSITVTREALQCFHHALNDLAGETLFAGQLPDFFERHPKFLPLQNQTEALFAISQHLFFGGANQEQPEVGVEQIEQLCLLFRKLERGSRWI